VKPMAESVSATANGTLDAALEYVDRDFSVIPVDRNTKRPFFPWAEFQKRRPTRSEVEAWWAKHQDANVAIVCGAISGIYCVDGDGEAGKRWIQDHLPPTTVYSITSRGIHAIYRVPQNAMIRNRVRLAPEVDVRGEGGYFVAPPSIHQSGHRYEWRFLGGGWDDIPEYAPPDLTGNLNLDLSNVQVTPLSRFHGVAEGERNDTLARLVGRWCGKGLDPDEIFELALAWNDKNRPPLPQSEVRRTVQSILRTHQRNHSAVEIRIPGPHEQSIPKEIFTPGGLLQAMGDYIEASSPVSHPAFNVLASTITLGAVAGQKIQSESGLRTNIYGIGLAYSGVGKNGPHGTIPSMLMRSRAHEILGPNTFTSEAALLKRLSQKTRENQLCFLDEIASITKALKNPNSPLVGIPALLMQLWSGTDRSLLKTYASGDEIVVRWHHLAFYGTSAPEAFWGSITHSEVADGFLARVIIFDIRDDAPKPKMRVGFSVPQSLVDAIDEIYTMPVETTGGNLEAVPRPHVVRLTDDAARILEEFADHYHQEKNRHKTSPDGRAAIYGRAAENAWKLAMVHALSIYGPKVVGAGIGRESMEWATKIIQWSVENTVRSVQLNVAVNEWHAWEQKILRLLEEKVKNKKKPGLTRREILKSIWGLSARVFDQLIETMLLSGRLAKVVHQPKSGPATTLYCLRKEEEPADEP